ncbi:hypothetical protein T484DRAFT_1742624 [Baffinella frigidus]|nr:hypothetical protein T484DRAFT_1742624 [Cryptophyta sp. CCMP2293]
MAPFTADGIGKVKKDLIITADLRDALDVTKKFELLIEKVADSTKDPSSFNYSEMFGRDLVVALLPHVDHARDTITPGSQTTLEVLIAAGVELPNTAAGLVSAMAILACLTVLFRHACDFDTNLVDSALEVLAEQLEELVAPVDPGGAGPDHAEYLASKLEYDQTKKRLEAEKTKIKNLYVPYVFASLIKSARSRGLSPINTATTVSTFSAGGTPAQLVADVKALIKRSSKYNMIIGKVDVPIFASQLLSALKARRLANCGPIGLDLQKIWTDTALSQQLLSRNLIKALEAWAFIEDEIPSPSVPPHGLVNLVFPPCPHCGKDNHHESTCFAKNPALLKAFQEQMRAREKDRAAEGRAAGAREAPINAVNMSKAELMAFGKKHFSAAIAEPEVDLVGKYLSDIMMKSSRPSASCRPPPRPSSSAASRSRSRTPSSSSRRS